MKKSFRSSFIIVGIIISIIFLFGISSLNNSTTSRSVGISEIVATLNDGHIVEITSTDDTVTAITDTKEKLIAKKEISVGIYEVLKSAGADQELLAKVKVTIKDPSGIGHYLGIALSTLLPFLLVIGIFWYMLRQAQKGSMQAMSFGKTKAKLAGMSSQDRQITFKDVAGLVEAKTEISEVVEFLRDPGRFHKLGARIPRGILLIGSPGTGKTLLAKAVANEASVPFFYVSGSEFVEMFVGVGANRVRDTFETAKASAPAIIFVDEIDAVGRHRGAGIGGGHDEREQTLNQILVEMDGFDTDDAVIVMAATNRPDILDPALLRPGRFDRRIILDDPSMKDRVEALKIHSVGKPIDPAVDYQVVAERTPGFSGADLANLVNEAAILAARANHTTIGQHDFFEAIEKVMLGPERRSHILSPREKEITAYHEAGHAIISASLPHSDPVHKISIISRGRAGGYTLKLPSQDKYLKTKSEFDAELAVLMGGYTAEQVIFNELTTGASNDLRVASGLARKMVVQFGMSEKFGPIAYSEKHDTSFFGHEFSQEREYSEAVAQDIDREVRLLIEQAAVLAKKILTDKLDLLKSVATQLIEKETLEQAEFYQLIGQPVPVVSSA